MHSHFEFLYFTAKQAMRIFDQLKKARNLAFVFFEIVKKSYIVPPHGNKCQIRNRCPHFNKKPRVGMASGFLTINIQSARFSKIRKFVPLIIFNCEPIFHVIRVLNFYVCQKTVPTIFEKKRLSVSVLCLSKFCSKVENDF